MYVCVYMCLLVKQLGTVLTWKGEWAPYLAKCYFQYFKSSSTVYFKPFGDDLDSFFFSWSVILSFRYGVYFRNIFMTFKTARHHGGQFRIRNIPVVWCHESRVWSLPVVQLYCQGIGLAAPHNAVLWAGLWDVIIKVTRTASIFAKTVLPVAGLLFHPVWYGNVSVDQEKRKYT